MSQEDGVFVWRDLQDWDSAVHRFLKDCVSQDVRLAIKGDPYGHFHHRDQEEIEGLRELLEEFQQIYSKIRMFHACRTEDVGSYLRHGFRTLDLKEQSQKARSIFLSSQFPQITDAHIQAAAAKLNNQGRESTLYFCLDDVGLITQAGHYLVYGSEYISAMATILSNDTGVDLKWHLRNIGIPTMFVCDVPHSLIQKRQVVSLLVEIIIQTIGESHMSEKDAPPIDFSFTFCSSLPACIITSHYHPENIPDTRVDGGVYMHGQLFCPFCLQNPD